MRLRAFLCCFWKEFPDHELKAAAHSLSPSYESSVEGKKPLNDTVLTLTIVHGEEEKQEVKVTQKGLPNFKEERPVRFGSGAEADVRIPADAGVGALHFQITYIREVQHFSLKDLGGEAGVFVQLDFRLPVPDEGVGIAFGDSFLQLEVGPQQQLVARFLDGELKGRTMEWGKSQSPVLLGRMIDCHVQLADINLSRYQCQFVYCQRRWTVLDGTGSTPSRNGTWLHVRDSFPLQGSIIFKAGHTLFQALA